jgi:hypothetical protein
MTEPAAGTLKRGRGRPPKLDAAGERVVVVKAPSDRKRGRPSSKEAGSTTANAIAKAPKEK